MEKSLSTSSVRRIIVAEVEEFRFERDFERDADAISLYINGEWYGEITVDQLREVIKVLEV